MTIVRREPQGLLALRHVQATIAKAKPLIAGFDNRTVTTPVDGLGLGLASAV